MNYHDKKTDHVSAQHYRDIDGLHRSFTYVDHDKKTSISVPNQNKMDLSAAIKQDRINVVNKILEVPAMYCGTPLMDFTLRGEAYATIQWNEIMLNDPSVPFTQLVDILYLASNNQNLHARR